MCNLHTNYVQFACNGGIVNKNNRFSLRAQKACIENAICIRFACILKTAAFFGHEVWFYSAFVLRLWPAVAGGAMGDDRQVIGPGIGKATPRAAIHTAPS